MAFSIATKTLTVFGALLTVVAVLTPAAAGREFGPKVQQTGPEQAVFQWPEDTCDLSTNAQIPDMPARAFRNAQNRIAVNLSNGEVPRVRSSVDPPGYWVDFQGNYRLLGTSLLNVEPEYQIPGERSCEQAGVHTNPYMPNSFNYALRPAAEWPPAAGYEPWLPGNFHDREWVDSPWAIDGNSVVALLHDNYQGWRDLTGDGIEADDCSSNSSTFGTNNCWYAAITMAKSTNGGATYGDSPGWLHNDGAYFAGPPQHLVASIPYRYVRDGGRLGIPEPSNIVKKGSYYYAMFRMRLPASAPDPDLRSCVMRTANVADPRSWRGWDGNAGDDSQNGFTVTFVNPYTYAFTATDTPEQHLCAPLSPSIPTRSVTYNRYLKKYMLIGEWDFGTTADISDDGVYYHLSSDLINWGTPQLAMKASGSSCTATGVSYPAVLDDNDPAASTSSTERNFYQPDQNAYLHFSACHDMIRIPVKFLK